MDTDEAWERFCEDSQVAKSASISGKLDTMLSMLNEIQTDTTRTAQIVPQIMGDSTAIGAANAAAMPPGGDTGGMPMGGAPMGAPPMDAGGMPPMDGSAGAADAGDAMAGGEMPLAAGGDTGGMPPMPEGGAGGMPPEGMPDDAAHVQGAGGLEQGDYEEGDLWTDDDDRAFNELMASLGMGPDSGDMDMMNDEGAGPMPDAEMAEGAPDVAPATGGGLVDTIADDAKDKVMTMIDQGDFAGAIALLKDYGKLIDQAKAIEGAAAAPGAEGMAPEGDPLAAIAGDLGGDAGGLEDILEGGAPADGAPDMPPMDAAPMDAEPAPEGDMPFEEGTPAGGEKEGSGSEDEKDGKEDDKKDDGKDGKEDDRSDVRKSAESIEKDIGSNLDTDDSLPKPEELVKAETDPIMECADMSKSVEPRRAMPDMMDGGAIDRRAMLMSLMNGGSMSGAISKAGNALNGESIMHPQGMVDDVLPGDIDIGPGGNAVRGDDPTPPVSKAQSSWHSQDDRIATALSIFDHERASKGTQRPDAIATAHHYDAISGNKGSQDPDAIATAKPIRNVDTESEDEGTHEHPGLKDADFDHGDEGAGGRHGIDVPVAKAEENGRRMMTMAEMWAMAKSSRPNSTASVNGRIEPPTLEAGIAKSHKQVTMIGHGISPMDYIAGDLERINLLKQQHQFRR